MNKYLLGALVVVAGIVGGLVVRFGAPVTQTGGDFAGGVQPSPLFTANGTTGIIQPVSGLPNLYIPGVSLLNDVIQCANGYSSVVNVSTTFTAAQFCGTTCVDIPAGAPAGIVLTLPTATSSYIACGSPVAGTLSTQWIIDEATNSVLVSPGVGQAFKMGYNGSTTIAASSTMVNQGMWRSSTTMDIMANQYK